MPSEKRAGRIQLILIIVFVGGAFLLSKVLQLGRELPTRHGGGVQVLNVTAVDASPGPYRVSFTTSAVVQARTRIQIVPEVTGRVEAIAAGFYPGGRFAAGEVLFALDPRDFEVQVASARAEVARAESSLAQIRAEAAVARAEWRGVDTKPTALALREPQLQAAEAALAGARAQLAGAELALSRSRYSLPFSGRVLDSQVALGQYLRASQAYGEVFDPDSLEVEASLADTELRWLLATEDPAITFEVDFLGRQRQLAGRFLRGASSLQAGTRFANVHFGFAQADPQLLPGVFVSVVVKGPELQDITALPASSRQRDGRVWRIKTDDTLAPLDVEIIYATDSTLAVRGLGDAVRVVTSRLAGASEGMQVKVVQDSDTAAQANPGPQLPGGDAPKAVEGTAATEGAKPR